MLVIQHGARIPRCDRVGIESHCPVQVRYCFIPVVYSLSNGKLIETNRVLRVFVNVPLQIVECRVELRHPGQGKTPFAPGHIILRAQF